MREEQDDEYNQSLIADQAKVCRVNFITDIL